MVAYLVPDPGDIDTGSSGRQTSVTFLADFRVCYFQRQEKSRAMDSLKFFHHPLYRKVLYFQWALIGLAAILEGLAWRFAPPDAQAANIGLSLVLLLAMAVQSLFVPLDRPWWQRLFYLCVEIALIAASSMCGVARFISPLFIVSVAKASLLLDRTGLLIALSAAFLCQVLSAGYKIYLAAPGLRSAPFSLWLSSSLAGSALIVTFTYGSLMVLVAVLVRSLLKEQQSRLATERLSAQVEALARDLERTRIAREIHDSLGHTLTALKIQLAVAHQFFDRDKIRSRQALQLAEELAARSLTDVRRAVESIRHADFDFKEAVAALAEEAQAQESLSVSLKLDLPDIPPAKGYQLYRIIQESITNTLKHAGATQISVNVLQSSGNIHLLIQDDGRGLEAGAEDCEGFGLAGIRERVESLKGTVEFHSDSDGQASKGACLKAVIPLDV